MPETTMTWQSITPAIPEIYLVGAICLVLLVDAFAGQTRRGLTPTLTLIALAVGAALTVMYGNVPQSTILFDGMYVADELAGHFRRYDPEVLTALLTSCGFTDIEIRQYGFPLGYVLEAARNQIGRRRLAASSTQSLAERTAGSGRLLQPSGGMIGAATRWGTAPFRVLQRAFPNTGTGLVVLARLAG